MVIYSLVKIGKPEHLDDFRKTGRMRMPRVATFQGLEDNVGRGDPHDGVTAWLQPDKCVVKFKDITFTGLVSPVAVSHEDTALHHVFCLHAITSHRLPAVLAEGAPAIDPENFKLGTHALIITNTTEFIRRVTVAAKRAKVGLIAGPVEYLDPDVYHGEVGAFRKFKSYAYQSEWRILVDPTDKEILWLELNGGLEDISQVVRTADINAGIKFSLPDDTDRRA